MLAVGSGRNLVYFLRSGYEVFGVDESGPQITQIRQMAAALAPHLSPDNFRVEAMERMSWESAISSHEAAISSRKQQSVRNENTAKD